MGQIKVLVKDNEVEISGLDGADAARFPKNGFTLPDKIKSTDKVSIFAPFKFIVATLKTPNLSGEELRQAVRFQIENLYPSIHTDLVYDYEKVEAGTAEEAGRFKVKAYLVKKSDIYSLMGEMGLLNAGIVIEKISSSGLAGKSLNFLPQDVISANLGINNALNLKRLLVLGSFSLIGLSILFLIGGILEFARVQSIEKKLTRIAPDYQKALPVFEGQKEKIKILLEKGLLETSHLSVTPSLFIVSKDIRDGVYLTRIEREGTGMTLEGRAKDQSRVIGYIASLNKSFSGEKAELRYSENMGEGNVSFKILIR